MGWVIRSAAPEDFPGLVTTDWAAFGNRPTPTQIDHARDFVEHDRLCCAFNHYTLEVEPAGGPLWLKLTGGEGVKEFIQTVFGNAQAAVEAQLIRPAPGDHLDAVMAEATPVLAAVIGKAQEPSV